MIKYIGSKRLLVPMLVEWVGQLPRVRTFGDVFSGTSRVGHAMKRAGYEVTSNDHNAYAYTLASCYVAADRDRLEHRATRLLQELQGTPAKAGYFTETYCVRSRFFQPKNGAKVDAIRNRIDELDLEPELRAVALVSLMEAADRVDSTTGLQMAYLKEWAPRAHNDLVLRLPDILPGPGRAVQTEAAAFVRDHPADVVYVDPPYNQHSYLRNYHIWETLVLWDAPDVYGVACKRLDCKVRTSDFNSKRRIHAALREVIESVRARHLLVSFNDEGYISPQDMAELLSTRGEVDVRSFDYKRYVGAQIGIHDLTGKKVGQVGRLRNTEFVFHVRCT